MSGPKQSTAKTVLNAITYKKLPGSDGIGVPEPIGVDITDLLKENNVEYCCIYGISTFDATVGHETIPYTNFAVRPEEINQMFDEVENVVDAAIVNANQAKAMKRLLDGIMNSFLRAHWDNIRG